MCLKNWTCPKQYCSCCVEEIPSQLSLADASEFLEFFKEMFQPYETSNVCKEINS